MIELLVITHALRLWSFMAGIIGVFDIVSFMRGNFPFHLVNERKWLYVSGYVTLCIFLIVAGLGIPLADILTMKDSLVYAVMILVAWMAISLTGWIKVIKFSNNMKASTLLAVATLLVAGFASFMVYA